MIFADISKLWYYQLCMSSFAWFANH